MMSKCLFFANLTEKALFCQICLGDYYVVQVNKKFCELKRGNIGIVEKAQETRFGMSPKYSRYIGIAS